MAVATVSSTQFSCLSGRPACVLRPPTHDEPMLLGFCVMSAADFQEEKNQENEVEEEGEDGERQPKRRRGVTAEQQQEEWIKKRAHRFNHMVHLKGDLCQEITSPAIYFTLIVKNGKANLGDMKTRCYELFAIEEAVLPATLTVGVIRKHVANSEYFMTDPKEFNLKKMMKMIRDNLSRELFKVKKCDRDITEPVEVPDHSPLPVKWITRNIDKPPSYFIDLNVFGSGIMSKLSRPELLEMEMKNQNLLARVPFYGEIRNKVAFERLISSFHQDHQDRIGLSFRAAAIYHELVKKEQIFKQYWLDERDDERWDDEVLQRLLDELKGVVVTGVIASQSNARFLKLRKYDVVENKIKNQLSNLEFCGLVPYDVDDDENYRSALYHYYMEKHAKDRVGIVTFVARRRTFLSTIFPGVMIHSVSQWRAANNLKKVDYLFVDRTHAADLRVFYNFLESARVRKIRKIYFFGSRKGISDGVGNPFKAMCKSKAPKFSILRSDAPKMDYFLRPDKIDGFMRLDEYIQQKLSGEFIGRNELIIVSSVARMNDILDRAEGKISENVVTVWHKRLQNDCAHALTCILLEGMDRNQLMKCYNCANDAQKCILFLGSRFELEEVCMKKNRNLGNDHFSIKLMDVKSPSIQQAAKH